MGESGSHANFVWLAKTAAGMLAPDAKELHPALERWFLAIFESFASLIGRGRQ